MGNVSSVKELYSHKQIQDRIVNMAAEMTLNYKDDDEIVVICLLILPQKYPLIYILLMVTLHVVALLL